MRRSVAFKMLHSAHRANAYWEHLQVEKNKKILHLEFVIAWISEWCW